MVGTVIRVNHDAVFEPGDGFDQWTGFDLFGAGTVVIWIAPLKAGVRSLESMLATAEIFVSTTLRAPGVVFRACAAYRFDV
jgi:hypothetical protein